MRDKAARPIFALALLLAAVIPAFAHPMGNFSVNHYSKITLTGDRIVIRYFIDLAEIPAYQELQQGNITAAAEDPTVVRFIAARGEELAHGLSLAVDGKPLTLRMISSGVIFPPGAGGLPTMKMGFVYEADYPAGLDGADVSLHYSDKNYEGHTGWKEIIASSSAGSIIKTSVPATDRSAELSNYPTDLLSSPPQNLEAALEAALPPLVVAASPLQSRAAHATSTPTVSNSSERKARAESPSLGSAKVKRSVKQAEAPSSPQVARAVPMPAADPSLRLKANQQQTPRSKFTELITEQRLSLWFLLTAALIAVGLGALHALEPGHGKTIVAAYLVGSRGTARHAVLLGMIVTASHTAGVFALGVITLYASRYIVPEQLYPWLGVFSGITIACLGCHMFLRRATGTATDHSHAPGSSHLHWLFTKRPNDEPAEINSVIINAGSKSVSFGQLFTLGITGGIIPCPAALIVLLSAFALHRIALGFFLIVAFSIGLAAVLIGFGMMMVYARRFMTHLQIDGPLTRRWLPLASSGFITILGAGLVVQAFSTMHLSLPAISKEHLGPALFVIGLGMILGMRHSTDADHVVAISTIVSKQRSIRNAALIGSVWGLGHTITIFAVGALIILFGVEIPPRLGLSMEFCVALMLVLLGVLNLSGVMQRITRYFTPAQGGIAGSAAMVSASQRKSMADRFMPDALGRIGMYQCIRPLVIGLVHGLAGSAAVALLVLSTIHNPIWATAYLLIFGGGTMIGMMIMTAAIATPLAYAGDRFTSLGRYFGVASGMVSLCFGSFLVYQLGFLGGLFTSHPHWTPQ
jgi:ABC-type nickel/cobalt efflux system permease component RcnA